MNTQMQWAERELALEPAGAVAQGSIISQVLQLLRLRDEEQLGKLSVVSGSGILVILGRTEQLPWTDGLRYCAPAPEAPSLWLPTWLQPELALDLMQSACSRRARRTPLLLWHSPDLLLPLNQARSLSYAAIDWLSGVH